MRPAASSPTRRRGTSPSDRQKIRHNRSDRRRRWRRTLAFTVFFHLHASGQQPHQWTDIRRQRDGRRRGLIHIRRWAGVPAERETPRRFISASEDIRLLFAARTLQPDQG